ncbi:MAG: dephospho-CoA kinase [Acidimicrobiales bacterium]
MIEIGLTGGIGSGKSTVADGLVARGAVLIDADRIVRELQEPGEPVFEAMVERWGEKIVAEDGSLDRAAVARIAFSDEAELKALNAIVHPAVGTEMVRRREEVEGTDAVVLLDIPLLVRADGQSIADQYANLAGIIVVDIDPALAVQRLVKFRGFSKKDAEARIKNQATRAARRAVADRVIDNSGTLEELEPQISFVWSWITTLPHPKTPRN